MNKKIKVSIVGGSGYTGIELLRLLALHPHVEILYITSRNDAGKFVCDIYSSLRGVLSHKFVDPDKVELGGVFGRSFISNHLASTISCPSTSMVCQP